MYLYRSNRTENLVEALCEVVSAPAIRPFEPETVVVQSRGMQRWLSLRLAERLGVWSNARFPFPRSFIESALDAVLEEPRGFREAFARERLTWGIAAVLPEHLPRREFAAVRDYLRHDTTGTELVELSRRIAHVYDQYVVYRPELVTSWEAGHDQDWQAELWRTLIRRHGSHHLAARAARFRERWPLADSVVLPARVCVFGVGSLPPLFVNILAVLAERCPVHLFLLSPSREYLSCGSTTDPTHPLLRAWGRVARDMQDVLESSVDYVEPAVSLYGDPGTACMLHALQSDALGMRRPGRSAESVHVVRRDDLSISVHACHGPMRQVQVLRDQLLAAFAADPTLSPHDVLVMVPDIELYAPLIDDVFGFRPNEPGAVPYRIADRARRSSSDVFDALLSLLGVLRGRFQASAVLALLDHQPLLCRFGIEPARVSAIRYHVQAAGIRWAVDAPDRERAGQPPSDQNTWRFGLRRLLLGYAMPGEGRALFAGVLPYDELEGDTAVALGQFAELCDELFVWRERVRTPRSVGEWVVVIRELTERMLAFDRHGGQPPARLNDTLEALAGACVLAGFDRPVEIEVVERELLEQLSRDRHGHDFVTGGVTFCAMLPMRSIPCRWIGLLGMDDGVFPRTDPAPAFDRIASRPPRIGDRSLREEDRALVLEALLSARERLIVTYTGREPRDNSTRPPSVVVSELLGALDEGFVLEPAVGEAHERSVSAHVTVVHPLQAHSPRHFGADLDPRLFSYSSAQFEVARALSVEQGPSRPWFSRLLTRPSSASGTLELGRFVRFFELPARFLLQERLGLHLGQGSEPIRDREPLELDALERFELGATLLERCLDDEPCEESIVALRATGVLPPGNAGRYVALSVQSETRALAELASRWRTAGPPVQRPFELELGPVTLVGVLDGLWPEARVTLDYGRVRARQKLRAWLPHLVLSALGEPIQSVLIGRPEPSRDRRHNVLLVFEPMSRVEATDLLVGLVSLFELGMRGPLAFFPDASLAFCEEERRLGDVPNAVSRALTQARDVFRGVHRHVAPQSDDPYVRRAFGDRDPIEDEYGLLCDEAGTSLPSFAATARQVFHPMLGRTEASVP
ncbi:MAG: exodeoxyribonuclease V subunit gamma [Polyangiaceae bacterium]|nr:exodeoxyribonuclease V subunit gamma [Polyangiaceae bacterium]